MDSPLGLELGRNCPWSPRKDPLRKVVKHPSSRVSLGADSPALGRALQGCLSLIGEPSYYVLGT